MTWYPVPPYRSEGWKVLNEKGELVATFETKNDCVRACEAVNKRVSTDVKEADSE